MKAQFFKHILQFKRPGGTSRGVLHSKDTWFIVIRSGEKLGIGECGMFRGLSADDQPDFEDKLRWACDHIDLPNEQLLLALSEFPSIQFGVEMALRSLDSDTGFALFPSAFTRGEQAISINGLVWMGDERFMREQIAEKLDQGFVCIKMKIGAIDFNTELSLLKSIRSQFSASDIELRVDANGAFDPSEAMEKLKRLAEFDLHSIEQPIKQGQWQEMAALCEKTPLPIALDEELIGVFSEDRKTRLIQTIKPQFIILKPTLIGGWSGSDSWIRLAEDHQAGWWVTSALESNIGLNAISQYTFTKNSKLPQGLGTGGLFTNNIDSPLVVRDGMLHYDPRLSWKLSSLEPFNNND